MRSHGPDVGDVLAGLIFGLILIYLAIALTTLLFTFIALWIIGLFLTSVLVRVLNRGTGGAVLEEGEGLVLILSGGFWALMAWVWVPEVWVEVLAQGAGMGWALARPDLALAFAGAVLGLNWGLLVAVVEVEDEPKTEDTAGLLSVDGDDALAIEESHDLWGEGTLIGEDV